MEVALTLARRGLGTVWPNPAVGCVIVSADRIVGRGWTQPGGRPHAETEALRRAGVKSVGATAYVTLEPCDHVGQTPPCSVALIEAGIRRVVIACKDPDPRVSGRGIGRLKAASIGVTVGVGAEAATEINHGFFSRIQRARPIFTLKIASSADGKTATRTGDSKWITNPQSRNHGHLLRLQHDAILVGRGTAEIDDPLLTCRLPGAEARSPVRVVLDSHLRLSPALSLFQTARITPTWIVTAERGAAPYDPTLQVRHQTLQALGVTILRVPPDIHGRVALAHMAAALAQRGITRTLVEGGATTATALLRAGLVDDILWYRSGLVIGDDGLAAVGPLEHNALVDCPNLQVVGRARIGSDAVDHLRYPDAQLDNPENERPRTSRSDS